MQCSPSFDWKWGKQNDPTTCWHQLHPRFQVLQQGKCPLATLINGGTPPLNPPPYSLFRPKGDRKTINFFSHFHGLVPDASYKHLESFIKLGTHSEPRRVELLHICDISLLRVTFTAK